MHILVTGGSGFIGSHLVNELLRIGDRVTVVDHPSTGRAENLENVKSIPELSIVHADLGDPELGKRIPMFLASTSEVYGKNPKPVWNEEDDLVFGSTTKPRWSYGASKAIDEFQGLACHHEVELPVVIGRFFNVVGPRQTGAYGMVSPRFVAAALEGRPLIVHDDDQLQRCFAHVRDVVGAVPSLGLDAIIRDVFESMK